MGAPRWTVGTACESPSIDPSGGFANTMPFPPARLTSADLSTREITPRSQTTTLLAVLGTTQGVRCTNGRVVGRRCARFTDRAVTSRAGPVL